MCNDTWDREEEIRKTKQDLSATIHELLQEVEVFRDIAKHLNKRMWKLYTLEILMTDKT